MSVEITATRHRKAKLVLAIGGLVLLALVVLAPLFFGLGSLTAGQFNFDYLLPFEAFPVTGLGMAFVLAVSLWGKRRRALTLWSLGGVLAAAVAGGAWAFWSGIATDPDIPNDDWRIQVGVWMFAVSYAALVVLTVAAALIVKDLIAARAQR